MTYTGAAMTHERRLPLALAPLAVLPALLLTAAAPVPAPLRDRIVADAAAAPPSTLAFERGTRSVRTGGGMTTNVNTVDRWDGTRWTLVSLLGKPPTPAERHDHGRQVTLIPVPGYYQLGPIIAAATASSVDAQGRTILTIPVLPADAVRTDSGDISDHLQAEARLARRGDLVWVDQLHVTAREPFRMSMLIKVSSFDQTSEYQLAPDGTPRLVSQKSESVGSMFGFPGGEKAQVTFTYR
ncbi:hypothetical protein [Polymorphobacter fuscus]|uniref:Uncharacterized protein n=1 Tax=Sandarakinorhabdus fusca TaxID=1439888 RepID=A0A7C9GMW4_9SPHN|nr:hypothetical protein [Polymorphobacter fuscus]KAB7648761.1 hypothetical protein F9290_03555 [Polymorphobacter fuscus]MQT16332.1 hypothetical protein [Polymorphobacter fuscus]NJC07380.1 hypothetical protein [Polymorphobacter fuscus]